MIREPRTGTFFDPLTSPSPRTPRRLGSVWRGHRGEQKMALHVEARCVRGGSGDPAKGTSPAPLGGKEPAAAPTVLEFPCLSEVWAPDLAQQQSEDLLLSAPSLILGPLLRSWQNGKFSPLLSAPWSGPCVLGTSAARVPEGLSSTPPWRF